MNLDYEIIKLKWKNKIQLKFINRIMQNKLKLHGSRVVEEKYLSKHKK